MKCTKDETYKLINEGRFHEAIDRAIKFHAAYRAYMDKKEAACFAITADLSRKP